MFSSLYGTYFSFQMYFEVLSAVRFNLDQSKIWSSGNGLIATFQLSSAASLNLGRSQNVVLGNRVKDKTLDLSE